MTATARPLLRARAAVFALFASFGIVLSTWAVHLPALKEATGISTSMLGTVLLTLGAGSLAGMQLTGYLIDRFGSEIVGVATGATMAATVTIPLTASTVWHALVGAFVFGVATGSADVAMNAAAVSVERDYGRPIMGAFHAVFSVGTVIGSLVGAVGFALHATTLTTSASVGAACIAVVWCAARGLRGRLGSQVPPSLNEESSQPTTGWAHRRRVLVLGALAFLLLLSEGSAMDWASLHAQQQLGASESMGALAVGSFLVAMTVGRLVADRVAGRIGPLRVLRGGAIVAAFGIVIVNVATSLPVTATGWVLFGLGLAGGVPQVFTAAGNLGGAQSGRVLSRVVGVGYLAILAGPGVMGWLVELSSWHGALLLPLASVIICAAFAGAVTVRKT